MTKKLYVENPYQQSFEATVEKVDGNKVWLDQTCFYPESGGQAGDMGTLNGQKVCDTRFDTENNIVHTMEGAPVFKTNDRIKGQIDWDRRYKIMRIHAASHIMEYFLFQVFGPLKLTGSHLNEKYDKSTYVSEDKLDSEKLTEVTEKANAFISQGLPIETWPDEKRPNFRHWKCGEIKMPCGGTHPKNTREIGSIKLKRETGGSGREKVITSLMSP